MPDVEVEKGLDAIDADTQAVADGPLRGGDDFAAASAQAQDTLA